MLRAVALASVLALAAGAALAQPQGDPSGYGAPPPAQPSYPPPAAGYPQGPAGAPGYGAPAYGRGGGEGRWGGDPETRALRQKMRAACATDLSTYCAGDGQGGHGALRQCMVDNHTRFSPPCQAAIADLHAHMRQLHSQGGAPGPMGPPSDMAPPNPPPPQ